MYTCTLVNLHPYFYALSSNLLSTHRATSIYLVIISLFSGLIMNSHGWVEKQCSILMIDQVMTILPKMYFFIKKMRFRLLIDFIINSLFTL